MQQASRSTCIESIWTNYMRSTRSYLCFRQLDLIWDTVYNRSTCRYTDDSDCFGPKNLFFNIYKLPNKDRRMDVAKWPTFWGWRTTKHTPKQTAAIAITVTVGRELKTLPEKMGLHDFLGNSLIRFTFITTSLFKSGTTSHLSTVAEPITAPILSFDLKSCKWHDNKITEG